MTSTTKAPKPRSEKALSLEQQAQLERLAAGEAMTIGAGGKDDDLPPAPVVDLRIMLGRGERFKIGPKEYDLAAYAFGVIQHGFELINACPVVLTTLAMMQIEDPEQEIDISAITRRINENGKRNTSDPAKQPWSITEIADMYASIPAILASPERGPELQDTLIAPVLLALQRNHPDLSADDLRMHFGIDTFMQAVESILRQNSGIRRSFKTAPASVE